MDVLADWMLTHGSFAMHEQRHRAANSTERLYWHYGYLMAQQDMLAMMSDQERDQRDQVRQPSL
ncbi:MAG: hypothetical protein NDI90_00145 [Nitrospira sp. BO4]|nr:hypothetical protein [Nitrospira sp. BO4]